MTALTWVAIAVAGAVGAVCRYLVDAGVGMRTFRAFPFGTLVVNLTGALALGLLTGLGLYHAFPSTPQAVLGLGFCGAYTTFSTFALETVVLAREGERLEAVLNVTANVVGGCLAAAIGLALAAAL